MTEWRICRRVTRHLESWDSRYRVVRAECIASRAGMRMGGTSQRASGAAVAGAFDVDTTIRWKSFEAYIRPMDRPYCCARLSITLYYVDHMWSIKSEEILQSHKRTKLLHHLSYSIKQRSPDDNWKLWITTKAKSRTCISHSEKLYII